MTTELAETGRLHSHLSQIGASLDQFLQFEHPDALHPGRRWREQLDIALPHAGIGIDGVTHELIHLVIPNGSSLTRPGASSFITTGGVTASTLASTAASIASPQRYGHTAFNALEELSLQWLAELFGLKAMQGVYSSGGSTANLLALGAARQWTFERLGHDCSQAGVNRRVGVYASTETHHTIQRSAGVLGIGRQAVRAIACDHQGRMRVDALQRAVDDDLRAGILPMAIVANAGTTNTGAIDPLDTIGAYARKTGIWFHVDGAYGLPGLLDDRVAALYKGLELADSAIVDPHKWLGASVGIGATFVRDRELLRRAFTQEPAPYLEGSMAQGEASLNQPEHSMDDFGVPYYDYGVELSAPCRGVVVWALIREIGANGMRDRIRRHIDMAAHVARQARAHPNLELMLEPTLSICCFRYVDSEVEDINLLNQRLHRQLTRENRNMPSTTRINGQLALRPCFVGARSTMEHAQALIDDVIRIGSALARKAVPIAGSARRI